MTTKFAAVDLFCGAGGLTYGFGKGGIPVEVAVDIDETCRYSLATNNRSTRFLHADVKGLSNADVRKWFPKRTVRVLAGCAPCQPFSKYTVRRGEDNRWQLLYAFLRIIRGVRPEVVSMENVPHLLHKQHPALIDFVEGLEGLGYRVWTGIVSCAAFGVPQARERFVLLAGSDNHDVELHMPQHRTGPTVRKMIGHLPPITAGAPPHPADSLHVSPALSRVNLARIRATPEGGGWRDWPKKLQLDCHKKDTGKYYVSVYGRMSWDSLAPTITTQCYGYGNGRFGHPEQDRAISLREAALLQTFPPKYRFVAPGETPTFRHIGRHIGNAVPPLLACSIAKSIMACYS